MKSRYFWEKTTFIRYSIVFENEESVLGRNNENLYRLFRKDTGAISFSLDESPEAAMASPKIGKRGDNDKNPGISHRCFAWQLNCS